MELKTASTTAPLSSGFLPAGLVGTVGPVVAAASGTFQRHQKNVVFADEAHAAMASVVVPSSFVAQSLVAVESLLKKKSAKQSVTTNTDLPLWGTLAETGLRLVSAVNFVVEEADFFLEGAWEMLADWGLVPYPDSYEYIGRFIYKRFPQLQPPKIALYSLPAKLVDPAVFDEDRMALIPRLEKFGAMGANPDSVGDDIEKVAALIARIEETYDMHHGQQTFASQVERKKQFFAAVGEWAEAWACLEIPFAQKRKAFLELLQTALSYTPADFLQVAEVWRGFFPKFTGVPHATLFNVVVLTGQLALKDQGFRSSGMVQEIALWERSGLDAAEFLDLMGFGSPWQTFDTGSGRALLRALAGLSGGPAYSQDAREVFSTFALCRRAGIDEFLVGIVVKGRIWTAPPVFESLEEELAPVLTWAAGVPSPKIQGVVSGRIRTKKPQPNGLPDEILAELEPWKDGLAATVALYRPSLKPVTVRIPVDASPQMAEAIRAVASLLGDPDRVVTEFGRLIDEAAVYAWARQSTLDREAFAQGRVVRSALLAASLLRIRDAGALRVAVIKPFLDTPRLMHLGPFFDWNFKRKPGEPQSDHGVDAHFIQPALVAPVLKEILGDEALPLFYNYLSDHPELFDALFDRYDANFGRPESRVFQDARRVLGLR